MLNKFVSVMKDRTNYVIDIGASDCRVTDPMYQFITSDKFRGLCIEPSKQLIPALKKSISNTFSVFEDYINPENIIDVFRSFNVPESPDFLKIDIDGYDLEVLRAILNVYKPKVIICEINEKIPPPVLFEVKYKKDYVWDFSHHFGFSISAGEKVMTEHNYKIVSIYELNNIVCINHDLCDSFNLDYKSDVATIYNNDYIMQNRSEFYWNQDVNYWLTITDPDVLRKEICNYFENLNSRSNLRYKTKVRNIDFILE